MIRLQLDLANAEKKVLALEGQLDKILKDKNKAIEELTRKNATVTEQLNAALAEIERLKLQQPDDELKEQLAKALRELEELKKRYVACQWYRKRKKPAVPSGAYEPPKATKEHETSFHDNPNGITNLFDVIRNCLCIHKPLPTFALASASTQALERTTKQHASMVTLVTLKLA